MERELQEKC